MILRKYEVIHLDIILNEREYAERMLSENELGEKPFYTLTTIAKYYLNQHFDRAVIIGKLEDFILRCDPESNINKWSSSIETAIKRATKYPLVEIDYIPVSSQELSTIKSAGRDTMQRLLFTLVVLAKYRNMVNQRNDNWVGIEDREIFRMANLQISVKEQSRLVFELREHGYVKYSGLVDNLNLQVLCLHGKDEALAVYDLRNLGNQWRRYQGQPCFECACCGRVYQRRSNAQKYCLECAREVNRVRALERWRTENLQITFK